MTKRVPIRVLKKPTIGGPPDRRKRTTSAMVTGIYSDLSGRNLDQRSKLAKALRATTDALTVAIGGNPSPQQRILIDRAVYKLARCTLFESATLAGDTSADEHYLAWSNSLRLDLQALGLDHVDPPVSPLQDYIRSFAEKQAAVPEKREPEPTSREISLSGEVVTEAEKLDEANCEAK